MKGGHRPIHIQRWCPADYVNDPAVRVALATHNLAATTFYPLFLFYSFLQGGRLPHDALTLSALFGMRLGDVRRALAYWQGAGKIHEEDGFLFHRRVQREVDDELRFRSQEADRKRKERSGQCPADTGPDISGRPPESEAPAPLSVSPSVPSPSPVLPPTTTATAVRPPAARAAASSEAAETTRRMVSVFNAVFGRKLSALPSIEQKVAKRLKGGTWQAWQIVAAPLLVEAQNLEPRMRKALTPEILLRDGTHPRTTADGRTCGATDWLERAYQRVDQTILSPRLAELAREADVLERLRAMGVALHVLDQVRKPSESGDGD